MAIHRFRPNVYYTTFGPHDPALHIADGDTVITTAVDNAGHDAFDQKVTNGPNPLTGPFYIEDAEPGNTIAVRLDRLWPNRPIGRSSTVIAPNTVDPDYVPQMPPSRPRITAEWQLDLKAGTAALLRPKTKLGRLTLPLAPMLGCIGVAPPGRQAISSVTSSTHGGNMDYNGFVTGTTIYLPISAPGGLLFIGDGHAVQGDAEIAGTGIETSFDVQFTAKLFKDKKISWPRAENEEYIMTAGNARPLDQAFQHATTEMIRWLQQDFKLDEHSTHILLGQCAEYDIGNAFDPAYTMICKLKKKLLGQL